MFGRQADAVRQSVEENFGKKIKSVSANPESLGKPRRGSFEIVLKNKGEGQLWIRSIDKFIFES